LIGVFTAVLIISLGATAIASVEPKVRTEGFLKQTDALPFYSLAPMSDMTTTIDAGSQLIRQPSTGMELKGHDPARPTPAQSQCGWINHKVRRGDTLSRIFKRNGIAIREALLLVKQEQASVLHSLVPGRVIKLCKDDTNGLMALNYDVGDYKTLSLHADGSNFKVSIEKRRITVRHRYASGRIEHSLFGSARRMGISDKIVMQLVSIFGWDIDFALDLRRGDHYTLIYEEYYSGDQHVGTGDVIAAEFVNYGMMYRAIRHIDDNGHVEYFTPEGTSLRGTFLRTPVKFSRITSRFDRKRFHPMLKKWRAHKGIDYSAPKGTPILVTADGRIGFIGRKGGYGKTVVIRHGGTYSTLYGHLSRFKRGLRTGSTVEQGDVIGYVGSTGLATGTHLHYEFRVNGTHRDPLAYNMPRSSKISRQYRDEFLLNAQRLLDRIASYKATDLAQN
jgi:murein DD-endopeptidase MepM/ murein hydrolase activator NlpD